MSISRVFGNGNRLTNFPCTSSYVCKKNVILHFTNELRPTLFFVCQSRHHIRYLQISNHVESTITGFSFADGLIGFFLSARLIAETNSTETAVDGKLCTVCIIYTAFRRNFSSHSNVVRLKIHSPMYKYVFSFDWILKRNEERKKSQI